MRGIVWGTAGAILLRVVLIAFAVVLLDVSETIEPVGYAKFAATELTATDVAPPAVAPFAVNVCVCVP